MNTISPEKRRFILIADQSDLSDILKDAEYTHIWRDIWNLKKRQKIQEIHWKSFFGKISNPRSFFKENEPQEILELLSVLLENDLTWCTPQEARGLFKFKPEPLPVRKMLYCKHPLFHNCYLPPSSANVQLAREKIFRFTELSALLGAKSIQVEVGDLSNKKSKFSASFEEMASQIGLDLMSKSDSGNNIRVVKEYEKPKHHLLPKRIEDIPVELKLWLDYDQMFKSMATERIKYGLLKQSVHINVKEMLKIDGNIVAKFANYGINMGGNYEKLVQSSWNFIIEYWPKFDRVTQKDQNPIVSLEVGNRVIPLNRNTKVQEGEIRGLTSLFSNRIIAQVNPNPQAPTILGLQNLSHQTWTARKPDGSSSPIKPNRTIKLAVGTRINFGSVEGKINC